MNGLQKTICERLKDLVRKVEEGQYGEGDDLAEDALEEDIEAITDDLL